MSSTRLAASVLDRLDRGRKDDLTAKLIVSFKRLIGEGVFAPGARLPAERRLAAQLGVSRPSLRHALKVLEIMGVVTQRVGDGTYLSRDASAVLLEPMEFLMLLEGISYEELIETRLMIEPEIAAQAAERAAAADLESLGRILASMQACVDKTRYAQADLEFHQAICGVAGNRVCQLMLHVLQRAIVAGVMHFDCPVNRQRGFAEHKSIYQAICKRQPGQARMRMTEHLKNALGHLTKATEAEAEALLGKRIALTLKGLDKNR
jgi:GntR family transcriptional repressor for pyruvate dehydrogenase complex